MSEISRREAAGLAVLAGAAALASLNSAAAAEEKPKPEFDEKAERKHVMDCGMTEAEADCWVTVAQAAGRFFDLPKLHPMDEQEVAQAIHIIQHKLLSRPVHRKYKGLEKPEKK
jgi:hypothetical protein